MDKLSVPLRFVPFLRPMVWGGRRLAEVLPKNLPTDEPYGESWEISDHPLHESVVAEGPLAGTSLRTLLQTRGDEVLGESWPLAGAQGAFPWLVKFLDANDWLSVQVHPDDIKVRQLWPGEGGKTEVWFILDAQPQSRIYAGLVPGVGPEDMRRGINQGHITDLLHSFTPSPGDCVFLPAGTVHALGGGIVLAEIQQTSDATFRLFDWNRVDARGKPRQLHIEEGLAAIDWAAGPVQPLAVPHFGQEIQGSWIKSLVRCSYFHLNYFNQDHPFTLGGSGQMQVLIILQGQAQAGEQSLGPGQVWLLPACLPQLTIEPRNYLAGLACSPPSLTT